MTDALSGTAVPPGALPGALPSGATLPAGSPARSFADVVLAVSVVARQLGLRVPFYRSPPRPGLTRSIRRAIDGNVIVAIAVRDREPAAVQLDVVEGVVRANGLSGAAAARARQALLLAARASPGSSPARAA